MLTDPAGVKLRHCGFCGIEVSSVYNRTQLNVEKFMQVQSASVSVSDVSTLSKLINLL